MDRKRAPGLAFIFITLLIDVLGFGLIIPVLPHLVSDLSGGKLSHSAFLLGLLQSSFGLMQFLCAPLLGSLSDRFGRRPVLLLSLFFTAVDYCIMALAPSVGWLFLGRVLAGVTGASFTAASAYIADISEPEKRAQNFGLIGAAFGLGFIVGPALGGVLGGWMLRAPFWGAALLSILNCLYGLFVLPESLAPENRRPLTFQTANPVGGLAILTRYRWVLWMTGVFALNGLAQNALQSTWVLYTTYRFHWTETGNGLSLALIGLCSIGVQAGLMRTLVPKLGEPRTIFWGYVCNIIGFLGFALVPQGWMMLPVIPIWTLSFAAGPTTSSLLSRQYGADEQGAIQGATASLQSLTGVIGPLLATAVFGYFTSPSAPVSLPGAPFLYGAALIAVALILVRQALQERGNGESGMRHPPLEAKRLGFLRKR